MFVAIKISGQNHFVERRLLNHDLTIVINRGICNKYECNKVICKLKMLNFLVICPFAVIFLSVKRCPTQPNLFPTLKKALLRSIAVLLFTLTSFRVNYLGWSKKVVPSNRCRP